MSACNKTENKRSKVQIQGQSVALNFRTNPQRAMVLLAGYTGLAWQAVEEKRNSEFQNVEKITENHSQVHMRIQR